MNKEKVLHYIYIVILFLILPPVYKNIGMATFWFYSFPEFVSRMFLMLTVPIGSYVVLKKIILALIWLIRAPSQNNTSS